MDKKITSILHLNFYLTLFLLTNAALKISYTSSFELILRFILIGICFILARILRLRMEKILYMYGLYRIVKWVVIITIWWGLLGAFFPNQVYFSPLAIVFCILFLLAGYQGFFYQKMEQERIPFFSFFLPIIIVSGSFGFFLFLGDIQKAISCFLGTLACYFSFRQHKIVIWRTSALLVFTFIGIALFIYAYNQGYSFLTTNLDLYAPRIPFSIIGKGIGHSSMVIEGSLHFESLDVARLFLDEVGLLGLLFLNASLFTYVYLLIQLLRKSKDFKESHRLVLISLMVVLLSEGMIFNLSLLQIIDLPQATFPFLALHMDYIWWNFGFGLITGILRRQETLRLSSPFSA